MGAHIFLETKLTLQICIMFAPLDGVVSPPLLPREVQIDDLYLKRQGDNQQSYSNIS